MSGRDEQLGRGKDEVESRQGHAAEAGEDRPAAEPDERPPSEVQAEKDLLKSSGGDPLTQESD